MNYKGIGYMKNWEYNTLNNEIEKYVEHVSYAKELTPEFSRILLKRLYKYYPALFAEKDEKKLFNKIDVLLNPSLQNLLNPLFLPNMQKACERIVESLDKKEKILVWGDYDVDGITATTICVELFKFHGYEVQYYIPAREEGYGLNAKAMQKAIDEGIKLFITVDCGISNIEEIALVREKGIDVIVTDHHILPEELPNAYAIINPFLCNVDESFASFDSQDIALCGAGVAFFVMCHLNNMLAQRSKNKCDMREFLDLVALATIADMVPLRGINRILVKNGLQRLADTNRIGIQALKEISGYLRSQKLSTGQVSFAIAPRINAVGRMSQATTALELLLSKDYNHAMKLAQELDMHNSQRKQEEESIIEEAHIQAQNYTNDFSLVLANEHWNQGIIGIVASRMIEKYYKPTLILTQIEDSDYYKGSGRSTAEIDLYNALCACKDDLDSFGGHEKAAGVRIHKDNIESFRQNFNSYVAQKLQNVQPLPTIHVDENLHFSQSADPLFLQEIALLEPFGIGNAEPSFVTNNASLREVKRFGYDKKHLQLKIYEEHSGRHLHAKLWNVEDFPLKEQSAIHVVYSIEIEQYKGMPQVSMKLKDYKEA